MSYPEGMFERARELAAEGLGARSIGRELGVSRMTAWRLAAGRCEGSAAEMARRVYDPPATGPLAGLEPAQIENLLLRAVLDDLKGGGSHPASMSNRSKCELGERLRRATGLPLRCVTAFLRISRSSYECHRARLGRDRHGRLRPLVADAFEAVRRRGYRAVRAELRRRGVRVSEKVVRRLMREQGLSAARPRRRRRGSYAGEVSPAPPNLPLRDDGTHGFRAAAPSELWVTDITEFGLPCGEKCYLSPVIDCFDGRPVAWTAARRATGAMTVESLELACAALAPGEAPVARTDRGSHYRSAAWAAACERRGLTRSMSRKGRSGDNARAEGFFGLLKCEFFHGRDRAGAAAREFIPMLNEWMRWFRSGRMSQALGWLTPDEHRLALGYAV